MTAAVSRLRLLAAGLLLTALAFSQSPSRVVPDTKLDLVVDPVRFLSRALHLWEPEGAFGQLQNQAYGYLFPMGPFFALGRLAELPGWVVQRAWLASLLVVAMVGTVRLASRMGIGSDGTRLLAGVAYALSPRVLSVAGPISIEALPLALLPWVLLPLVTGAQGGSERRAAARSGLAVLCIGGVNAAATLAVLPLPALFLLLRLGSARGRRLAVWWGGAVALAGLWWALPLVLLGRYSLPFLDYIETADVTTAHTSLPEVLRGTSDWLAYLSVGGEPWWRAAHQLVSAPVLVLQTAVLAALGLAGMLRRDAPHRSLLLGGVLLGTALVTLGHVGDLPWWATPALGAPVRTLLDGPLAPFRNVHKFDAVLRLPLVLGLAHLATALRLPAPAVPRVGPATRPLVERLSGLLATPVVVVAVVALTATAAPALTGRLMTAGGFPALPETPDSVQPSGPGVLPAWWRETADWLAAEAPTGRALVVPGAAFGEYQWGRPIDEPLQALARAPWAVRNAIPLGSLGNTRLLDAVEARLEAGQGSPGLTAALRRAGVTYVVTRNDLDEVRTGAPRPVLVRQALQQSGLKPVVDFGPDTGPLKPSATAVRDEGLDIALPSVEIWPVGGPAERVTTYPVTGALRVSGGPESLLQLADRGLGDRATLLAGDPGSEAATATALTDGMRRRELDAGKVHDGYSATLTPDEPLRLDRRARDLVLVPGEEHLTTARYLGVRDVRASSSASDAGALILPGVQHAPYSGVDGDRDTAWISGGTRATGQWLELDLDEAQDVRSVKLTPLVSELLGAPVSRVSVTTDAGSRTTQLAPPVPGKPDTARWLEVAPGRTQRVRVTVEAVAPGRLPDLLVGVRDLQIMVAAPGDRVRALPAVERTLVLPADAADGPPAEVVALDRTVGQRPGCVDLAELPVAEEAETTPDKGVPGEGGGAAPTPAAEASGTPAAGPSAEPSATARPTAQPSSTEQPTTTAKPSLTAGPSATAEPTTTAEPSVTAGPSATAEPASPAHDGSADATSSPSGSASPSPDASAEASAEPDDLGKNRALCAGALPRAGEESGPLDRTFTLTEPLTGPVTVTARPVPGAALDALLAATDDQRSGLVRVLARSQRVTDPHASARMLLDDDPDTGWTAGEDPTLTVSLGATRTVDALRLVPDRRLAGARPTRIVVTTAEGDQRFPTVDAQGLAQLSAGLVSDRLEIQFVDGVERATYDPVLRAATLLPVALSELRVSSHGHPLPRPEARATKAVTLTCGEPAPADGLARRGPVVDVDGVPTRLHGKVTRRELLALTPVRLTSCGPVSLSTGERHLVAPTDSGTGDSALRIDAVTLGGASLAETTPHRTVTATQQWGPASRRLTVSGGPATYLEVHENQNPGWKATLDGRPLQPVRLDGWQQGFLLPAGDAAGTVELVYAPDRSFRAGLLIGLAGALLLLLLGLLRARPSSRPAAQPLAQGRLLGLGGAAVVVLLGGLAALPALALGAAARRWRLLPALGGGAMVLAGALVALAPWGGTRPPGADALTPQLLALAAVGTLAGALLPSGSGREPAVDGAQ